MQKHYRRALEFSEYLETVQKNRELWHQVYERARVPEQALKELENSARNWHFLVLSEDWCSDAVNLVPVVACLASKASNLTLRVLPRDENLDIMDAHLTNGRSRSIPIVVLLDENFMEKGWWGPRPKPIQKWFMETGINMTSEERSVHTRRYYAKDKGETLISELLDLMGSIS